MRSRLAAQIVLISHCFPYARELYASKWMEKWTRKRTKHKPVGTKGKLCCIWPRRRLAVVCIPGTDTLQSQAHTLHASVLFGHIVGTLACGGEQDCTNFNTPFAVPVCCEKFSMCAIVAWSAIAYVHASAREIVLPRMMPQPTKHDLNDSRGLCSFKFRNVQMSEVHGTFFVGIMGRTGGLRERFSQATPNSEDPHQGETRLTWINWPRITQGTEYELRMTEHAGQILH